jgi:hypothetical protein
MQALQMPAARTEVEELLAAQELVAAVARLRLVEP